MHPTFAHLPNIYPDETVHSLCSRFAHYARLHPTNRIIEHLFRAENIGSFVDLPYYLDRLLANFTTPRYTIEQLIFDHTLAPFYGVFWPSDRFHHLLHRMGLSNVPHSSTPQPSYLSASHGYDSRVMYCPACAAEQQQQYDEVYWTRLHQASRVTVCPTHHLFLERTQIQVGAGYPSNDDAKLRGFYYPQQFVTTTHHTPIDPDNQAHQLLLAYAEDVAWLLKQRFTTSQKWSITTRLTMIFARKGYGLLPNAKLPENQQLAIRLRREITEHYSDVTLHELGVPLTTSDSQEWGNNWASSVIPNRFFTTFDPFKHWLLIRFFGYSMEEFWALSETGCEWHHPYPCLEVHCPNFGADHPYSEPCIYGVESVS